MSPVLKKTVLSTVSQETGVSIELIKSPRRTAEIVRARLLAVILMVDLCPRANRSEIARFINKDHTSVAYGLRTYSARAARDPELREIEARVRVALTGEAA